MREETNMYKVLFGKPEGKRPNLRYYPETCLEGLRKTTKT
jgi:hypothetical protein